MTDDHDDGHGHDENRPEYDPDNVALPEREPPLRETAPQSDFTTGQVARGAIIAAVGLFLTFGLALALA